jgi:hypothetical protein
LKSKNRKSLKVKLRNKHIFILSISLLATCCSAQDIPAKLDAFNEAIGKEYTVYNKGKFLMVKGFREGKQVKLDKVNIYDLDFKSLKFSEKDQSVSVKCYSDLDGCVNRFLLLNKKKSIRARLVFGLADGTSGEEVKNNLELLLNDMSNKY